MFFFTSYITLTDKKLMFAKTDFCKIIMFAKMCFATDDVCKNNDFRKFSLQNLSLLKKISA